MTNTVFTKLCISQTTQFILSATINLQDMDNIHILCDFEACRRFKLLTWLSITYMLYRVEEISQSQMHAKQCILFSQNEDLSDEIYTV